MKMTTTKAEDLTSTVDEAINALEALKDYLVQLVDVVNDNDRDEIESALDSIEGWFHEDHGNVSFAAAELDKVSP